MKINILHSKTTSEELEKISVALIAVTGFICVLLITVTRDIFPTTNLFLGWLGLAVLITCSVESYITIRFLVKKNKPFKE